MNLAQLKYVIIDQIYDINDETFLLELKKLIEQAPKAGYKFRICSEDENKSTERKFLKK